MGVGKYDARLDHKYAIQVYIQSPVREERNLGVKSKTMHLKCKSCSRRKPEASYASIPAKLRVGVPPNSGEHRAGEKSADEI